MTAPSSASLSQIQMQYAKRRQRHDRTGLRGGHPTCRAACIRNATAFRISSMELSASTCAVVARSACFSSSPTLASVVFFSACSAASCSSAGVRSTASAPPQCTQSPHVQSSHCRHQRMSTHKHRDVYNVIAPHESTSGIDWEMLLVSYVAAVLGATARCRAGVTRHLVTLRIDLGKPGMPFNTLPVHV